MNKWIGMGRLTRDPEIRWTQGENQYAVARYTLAVDRRRAKEGEQSADFISCVVFGKGAEHAEKYYHKGIKIAVTGRLQTGSYTNKEGQKVYTTEVVVEEQEFAESKSASQGSSSAENNAGGSQGSTAGNGQQKSSDGFMNIPDDLDEELPFT